MNRSELAEKITIIFESSLQYINSQNDKWEEKGKIVFMEQIKFFINRNLQIQFVLPAFPFKSANHQNKTLSALPDKGEELALQNISNFCEKINSIYEPGVRFIIVSDGRVFADLFKVSDKNVDLYDEAIRKKFSKYTQHISFLDLNHFLDTDYKHDEAREKLINLFGKSAEIIDTKIKEDSDYQKMYLGFTRFIMEDIYDFFQEDKELQNFALKKQKNSGNSRNFIKNDSKKTAKKVMIRNDAYSTMVQHLFPLFVRLSIHAHNNAGPKFAIQLIPLEKISHDDVDEKHFHIPTPWHNVAVEDKNGKFLLMKHYKVKKLNGKTEKIVDEENNTSHYKLW